jgi:hypothetical protein
MQRNQCRVSRTKHIETVSRAAAVIKRRGVLSRLASISLGLLLVPFWCGEGSAAESASAAPAVPTAKLLFKSNFGPGVTLGEPSGGGKRDTYQPLIGTDRETGYTWPVTALGSNFSGVQLIAPAPPIAPRTLSDYVRAEIRTVPGPSGTPVSELFLNTADNGGAGSHGNAQTDFLIRRSWKDGDVTNLYTTFWFKLQPNLVASLDPTISSGNWKALTEFKTGGYRNTGGGDYRIYLGILKDKTGTPYWHIKGDDGANRKITTPAGAEVACPDPVYCPLVQYWREENHTVPVPIDTWSKLEVYWHRSSGADGRYWAAINGHVIVDHRGPNMGEFNLPITRIFSMLAYSGGHPPNESHTTGLEFWDGFPCGDGTPCYK